MADETFVKNNPHLQNIHVLLTLYTWSKYHHTIDSSCSYSTLFHSLLSAYLPNEYLAPIMAFKPSRSHGTIQHHVRSRGFKEQIVPNVLSNMFTRVKWNTDSHQTMRTIKQHYNFNYLLSMTSAVTSIKNIQDCVYDNNEIQQGKWLLVTPNFNSCNEEIRCGSLTSTVETPIINKINYQAIASYEHDVILSIENALALESQSDYYDTLLKSL